MTDFVLVALVLTIAVLLYAAVEKIRHSDFVDSFFNDVHYGIVVEGQSYTRSLLETTYYTVKNVVVLPLTCVFRGHAWIDSDPGDPEVGPQPYVFCYRCGKSAMNR